VRRGESRFIGVLAGLVVLGGLVAAHVVTASRDDEYTGVLLPLDHLFTVALVLGLFAIAAGLGGRLLKAGGIRTDGPLETLLFWTPVGLGMLASAIVVVGLFFSVRPLVLLALLAGAAFVGRNELRQLPSLVRDALAQLRGAADRLSLSIFLGMAVLLITGALAPPTDWDVLMYHLRVPRQFLDAGSIHLVGDNAQLGFVGLPHMLYLPLLALGSPAGPAVVSALCTLGLALAGFALAQRFLDERTAGLGLAVLWGSTMIVLVASTARTDTILALYLLLVHYAVLRAQQSSDARFLYLGAALAGMAFGVKYNALIYLFVLAPFGLWIVVTRLEKRAIAAALILGLVLATALPWLLKNGLLLGDPLYPFLGGLRVNPWLAGVYGGVGGASPAVTDPAVLDAFWGTQPPFNLVDLFVAPGRIAVEAEGRFYHHNLLLLLLPLWLLFVRDRVLGWLAAPALAYCAVIVLLHLTTNLMNPRYFIPALAPLTLVALHAYARVWDRLLSPGRVRLVLGATALLVLPNTVSLLYRHATRGRQLEYAVGAVSRQAFIHAWAPEYADVVAFVNTRLPKESLLLMLFEARGYYVRVPAIQDNALVNWPLLSAKGAARDCLRSAGVTHVLVYRGALEYYVGRGLRLALLGLDAFEAFARDCLSPIYANSAFTVFQVQAGAAQAAGDLMRKACKVTLGGNFELRSIHPSNTCRSSGRT
jgi:4-amino-4-deoxy-L-arabinose transferase-like glycosyltransferase